MGSKHTIMQVGPVQGVPEIDWWRGGEPAAISNLAVRAANGDYGA